MPSVSADRPLATISNADCVQGDLTGLIALRPDVSGPGQLPSASAVADTDSFASLFPDLGAGGGAEVAGLPAKGSPLADAGACFAGFCPMMVGNETVTALNSAPIADQAMNGEPNSAANPPGGAQSVAGRSGRTDRRMSRSPLAVPAESNVGAGQSRATRAEQIAPPSRGDASGQDEDFRNVAQPCEPTESRATSAGPAECVVAQLSSTVLPETRMSVPEPAPQPDLPDVEEQVEGLRMIADGRGSAPAERTAARSLSVNPAFTTTNASASSSAELPITTLQQAVSVPRPTPVVEISVAVEPMETAYACSSQPLSDQVAASGASAVAQRGLIQLAGASAGRMTVPTLKPVEQVAVENIAAETRESPEIPAAADAHARKLFLKPVREEVATDEARVGTGVANSPATMLAFAFKRHADAEPGFLQGVPVVTGGVNLVAQPTPVSSLETNAPALAHRAVDAVLTAVERVSSTGQHAVNLQFSFGGTDLSVRVELRQEEVRTTFRTDSGELRQALAHEWQAVNADPQSRSLRLAEPTFAANSRSDGGPSAFSDHGTSHQGRENHRSAGSEFSQPTRLRAAALQSSTSVEPVAIPSVARGPFSTSRHLHTVA